MTNREQLNLLTDKEFAEWVIYTAPTIGRTWTDSAAGVEQWLKESEMIEKTAEQMFEDLGFKPDAFNGIGNMLRYFYEIKYNANARFIVDFDCNDDNENYTYYYQVKDPLNNNVIFEEQVKVNVYLHKAITKQMEELGWLERK